MTRPKLHVRTGDMVEAITGEARGLRGRVLRAMPRKRQVVVEGMNVMWKHIRPSREHPRGGRIQIEAPIDASNVQVICQNRECEHYDRPVRTATELREDGPKLRVCAKCGHEIPTPE